MNVFEAVMDLAARRGFFWPACSYVYPEYPAGLWVYGPYGLEIKRKIINLWRKLLVNANNAYEIETPSIMPISVFVASGHMEHFNDRLVECKKCHSIFRADHLIEEKLGLYVEGKSAEEMTEIIKRNNLKCPKCNGKLSEVKWFNLMFKTNIGPIEGSIAYLRPETAQNIFINFKRIFNTYRGKLPFGIAQIGLSFRNEISPRNFLIRLRGFHQMEIEMFFDPKNENCPIEKYYEIKIPLLTREAQRNDSNEIKWISIKELIEKKLVKSKWQAYFLAKEFLFFTEILKIPKEKIRFRHVLEEETPFYSKGNFDLEVYFEGIGWKEVVGNAYRTDYDLSIHSKHSKEDLSVTINGRKIIPHVAEPSFGIDRILLAIFFYSYKEKGYDRDWDWLKLPLKLAPYLVAVFPLLSNNEEIVKKARKVFEKLRKDFDSEVIYDEKGSIGKRYARIDEIGVPFAVTIDHQTLKDETVTIRFRDTKKQIRIKILEIANFIRRELEKFNI